MAVGNTYPMVHKNLPKQYVHWTVNRHRLPASLYFVCAEKLQSHRLQKLMRQLLRLRQDHLVKDQLLCI